jgi:hypothetical protein
MVNTATIIPIHPPKFVFGEGIVHSWNKHSTSDLYFVFSNLEDADNFANTVSGRYKTIVLPEELRDYSNMITVKKFYGISNIIEEYDYVCVFDAEMKVIRHFDTDNIYEEVWKTRELKCNLSWAGADIIRNNSVLMACDENEDLIRETENFNLYWWFNEICVYEKNTFKEFFDFLNSSPHFKTIYNNWECFDYILYGIWLICFKGFKCRKLFSDKQFVYGAVEHNQFNIDGVTETFQSYMDSNMFSENYEHIKVHFHFDRYV